MKKILALLLALVMLFSLASCASSLTEEPSGDSTQKEENKTDNNNEEDEDAPIEYPDEFSAGFGREEMVPNLPIKLGNGNTGETMADTLYATCVAVHDGEKTALFFHMDMKEMPEAIFDKATEQLTKEFGIPAENVIMTATHTHVAPHTSSDEANNIRWRGTLYEAVVSAAEQALRDLVPTEVAVGTGDATGFTFVRRYLMNDGTYKWIPGRGSDIKAPESAADPELRTIHFIRENAKDIVMANFQTHYCGDSKGITSDFVHYLRQSVEKDMDMHFAYFNGGSANISAKNYMGDSPYASMSKLGPALAEVVAKAVKNEEKVKTGPLEICQKDLEGTVRIDSAEKKEGAIEWAKAIGKEKDALLSKYGFASQYEAIAVNARAAIAEGRATNLIPVTAISFGDVAVTANPFEMFDISCREIREASPFKMTFTCSYSNAHQSYMPPDEIFPHGEYEVYVSRFEKGTAEMTVNEIVSMLNEQKK